MSGWRTPRDVEQHIRDRAAGLCECCHANERWQYVRFTVDHVQPRASGGADTPDNLALACFHCNRRKSDRATGVDPTTTESVPLYDPRRDAWATHFRWSADRLQIEGLTPIGRATVTTLHLNRERVLQVREADLAIGRHPPLGDPIAPSDS